MEIQPSPASAAMRFYGAVSCKLEKGEIVNCREILFDNMS